MPSGLLKQIARTDQILQGLPSSDVEIDRLISDRTFLSDKNNLDDDGVIDRLAGIILDIGKKGTKVISLIGGTASGKTTLTKRLMAALPKSDSISPDDFLVHDTAWRRANVVAKNRPATEKYDPETMRDYVKRIRTITSGQILKIPKLDYATGIALAADKENYPHILNNPLNYLIIEGDFNFVTDSDLLIYFHVPDVIRNRNRFVREVEGKGETNIEKLLTDMRNRHTQQQLRFTLPVAHYADWLIVASPAPTANNAGYRYSYSVYTKAR